MFEEQQVSYETKAINIAFDSIKKTLTARREQRNFLNQQLTEFTRGLYGGLQLAVRECREKGMVELAEPRLLDHPSGDGRKALQLGIEDWSVIFVPMVGLAWPNARDEAQIPGASFRELAARIACFIGSEPETNSFFDFVILPNGSWFAWGFGWPKQAANLESTNFKVLAYELIASFLKDVHTTWRTRATTSLGMAMDARKRAFLFGLPGDE
jgi:hypothetical protein